MRLPERRHIIIGALLLWLLLPRFQPEVGTVEVPRQVDVRHYVYFSGAASVNVTGLEPLRNLHQLGPLVKVPSHITIDVPTLFQGETSSAVSGTVRCENCPKDR